MSRALIVLGIVCDTAAQMAFSSQVEQGRVAGAVFVAVVSYLPAAYRLALHWSDRLMNPPVD